jgi:hypothetical protein
MADLIKVSIQGQLPNGEVWSINPVWRLNTHPVSVTVTQCQAIVTAVNNIVVPTAVRNIMSSQTTFNGCRVEARAATGELESLAEGVRAAAVAGSGANPHPFQTSLVVSLRSPLAGASGRGRLYLPATGMQIATTSLRPPPADMTSIASGTKTYLAAIQTAVTSQVPDSILGVWSRTLATVLGVTRIQIGDVLDVQRRRRDSQVENYTELAFP